MGSTVGPITSWFPGKPASWLSLLRTDQFRYIQIQSKTKGIISSDLYEFILQSLEMMSFV